MFNNLCVLHTCGGFTLAGCWVPTKFALSLLLDRGEKIKGSWIGIRAGRFYLLRSQAKQIGLEEMSWIHHQSNQNRAMKNPKNTFPLPSLIHRLNFPPSFLCLFPQQFRGWAMRVAVSSPHYSGKHWVYYQKLQEGEAVCVPPVSQSPQKSKSGACISF